MRSILSCGSRTPAASQSSDKDPDEWTDGDLLPQLMAPASAAVHAEVEGSEAEVAVVASIGAFSRTLPPVEQWSKLTVRAMVANVSQVHQLFEKVSSSWLNAFLIFSPRRR